MEQDQQSALPDVIVTYLHIHDFCAIVTDSSLDRVGINARCVHEAGKVFKLGKINIISLAHQF